MSTVTEQLNQGNFAINNYDVSKVFVWDNRFETMTFINDSGAEADFAVGTLLGRNSTTGNVKPLASGAADNSNIPVGVLAQPIEDLANNGTISVAVCVSGDVDQNALVLDGSDTLDTVIATRRLRDRIAGDTLGIKLVDDTELTNFDNS